MNIRVRVDRDSTNGIGTMPQRLDAGLEGIANWAADTMGGLAERDVPQRTSLLFKMIASTVQRVGSGDEPAYRAIVGIPVGERGYGPYVEFGTGQRGMFSHAIFAAKYGWPHIDYKTGWMGQVAQPFLTPQPFAVKDEVDRRLAQLLFDEWHQWGG